MLPGFQESRKYSPNIKAVQMDSLLLLGIRLRSDLPFQTPSKYYNELLICEHGAERQDEPFLCIEILIVRCSASFSLGKDIS